MRKQNTWRRPFLEPAQAMTSIFNYLMINLLNDLAGRQSGRQKSWGCAKEGENGDRLRRLRAASNSSVKSGSSGQRDGGSCPSLHVLDLEPSPSRPAYPVGLRTSTLRRSWR